MPSIRGLNVWTLGQKIKDKTTQRTSTIQLLQKIDIYHLSAINLAKLVSIADGKEQIAFLQSHGKLDRTTGEMKSHSFVLQFSQCVIDFAMSRTWLNGSSNPVANSSCVRDTGNTLRQLGYATASFTWGNESATNAPAANTTYGILVGTGTTAPASLDYVMQTLTAQGSAANQLQYQATAVGSSGVVGSNVDTVIARVLVNGSGGTITIREVGIGITQIDSAGSQRYFLVAHDAVNQAIANGEIAIVSYDVRTTV